MKFKRLILKILLCVFFISSTPASTVQHIITTKGIDGLNIGEVTLKAVRKKFPKGKIMKDVRRRGRRTALAHGPGYSSFTVRIKHPRQVSTSYTIDKEGISFYFNYKDTLSSITIWGKEGFTTDKGIVLGKSTFHDLDSIYETDIWWHSWSHQAKSTLWTKSYKNLHFYSADTLIAKRSDDLIINHIEITY